MSMHEMVIVLIYLSIGAGAGLLSGLLGIGGGLLVVPSLAFIFMQQKVFPEMVMHQAIGTSLAIMIFTTARSLLAHLQKKIEFWSIYRQLLPGVAVGVVLGSILAHFLHSSVLAIVFAIFVLVIGVKMLLASKVNPKRQLPHRKGMAGMGLVIGGKSGLLGIGGGALTIPFLTYCNVPMRQAVVVSVATGLTVAVIGTVIFTITGLTVASLPPFSFGYVYLPAVAAVAIGSVITAPIGAGLSHRLPVNLLKRIFGVFLLFVGVHMLLL